MSLLTNFTITAQSRSSNLVGELSLTGHITNVMDTGHDSDGLGISDLGELYAIDIAPGSRGENMLYQGMTSGGSPLGGYTVLGNGKVTDVVFVGALL